VCANKHLAQLDEVAVLLVVDLNDTPGVATAADLAAFRSGDLSVGTDNGEGNLVHDFVVLGDGLLVVELVARALEDLDVVVLDVAEDLEMMLVKAQELMWRSDAYTLLECGNLVVGESVGLGDDGDKVDLGVQAAHDLDIKRLERVTSRLNEVDTGVDAVVDNVHAVDLVLGVQVSIEALLDVLNDWAPGVVVVDKVTKARGVNDSQAQANAVLLDIGADGLDVDGLGCEVERWLLALLRGVKRGVEEGVDQSGLSEPRLT